MDYRDRSHNYVTDYGRRLAVRLRDGRCVASVCHHRDLPRHCSSMGPVTSSGKPVLHEPVPRSFFLLSSCHRKIVLSQCRLVNVSSVRHFFLLDRFFRPRDRFVRLNNTPSVYLSPFSFSAVLVPQENPIITGHLISRTFFVTPRGRSPRLSHAFSRSYQPAMNQSGE